MPTGIDTYIIKTASVCNLNCSYCYYYNGADTSFKGRPRFMSRDITRVMTDKIIKHASEREIPTVDLTLHGGEPLLMKKQDFEWMMREFDRIDAAGIKTRRKCQTNAVRLDEEWVDLLTDNRILLGVSMDGPKEVHDEFRVDHAGKGSYERVIRGLRLALAAAPRGLRTSVLSVINPRHPGALMYRHLRGLGVKKMDFLLPESNYAHLPHGYVPLGDHTPYGDFLNEVLEAWLAEDDPEVTVRILNDVLASFMHKDVRSDVIGTAPVQVAVIETDGSLEPTDNFKACEDGMTVLGLSILEHDFDALYEHPFFDRCKAAATHVPSECQRCPFLGICGGGRITTRYSQERGFDNPSIYCHDLQRLFFHARHLVEGSSPEAAAVPS